MGHSRPELMRNGYWMNHCAGIDWESHKPECGACGGPRLGRREMWCSNGCEKRWKVNHWWTYACVVCGEQHKLEINHKIPFAGQNRRDPLCLNHQDNLEVLCHAHHVEATALQRLAGLFSGPADMSKPNRPKERHRTILKRSRKKRKADR